MDYQLILIWLVNIFLLFFINITLDITKDSPIHADVTQVPHQLEVPSITGVTYDK